MNASHADLERRVERNTNDIEAIYEILADHGQRLTAIQAKLGEHDARFDSHDARFDSHDARFDSHDARFDSIDATLAEVLRRLPEQPAS